MENQVLQLNYYCALLAALLFCPSIYGDCGKLVLICLFNAQKMGNGRSNLTMKEYLISLALISHLNNVNDAD